MPTLVTGKFPKLKSEDEFEDLATDLLSRFWRAPVERHGRRGQEQHGVDASAEPPHLAGDTAGAQYKNVKRLSIAEIEAEVAKAEGFEPGLAEFMIVTSVDRDVDLQRDLRVLRTNRRAAGQFLVSIWFWQDMERELAAHPDLVAKYFGEWRSAFAPSRADAEDPERAVVDWSTFYVTLSDDAPRSETYLMLRAEPVQAAPLVLDGELVDAFRSEVEQVFGVAAQSGRERVQSDAVDLFWRSPGGRMARKWRRGGDGSLGFVSTLESAFQSGRLSLWEVAVDCLSFFRLVARVLPGQAVCLTLDLQPGELSASPHPLAPADAGKAPMPGMDERLTVVGGTAFKAIDDHFAADEVAEPFHKLAVMLFDRWRVMFAQQRQRVNDLAARLAALAHSEGLAPAIEAGSPLEMIALGPEVIAWGRTLSADASRWVVEVTGFASGDEKALRRFIDADPADPQRGFALLEGLGEGRLLAGSPSWKRTAVHYEVTLPIAAPTPRTSALCLGRDLKIGDDGDVALEDGDLATVEGVDAAGQLVAVALGTQLGEWFLDRSLGARVREFHGRREDARLVERLWKLEIVRLATVPTASGEVQLDFIRRVDDVRIVGYEQSTTQALVEVSLELEAVGPWSQRIRVFLPQPPPGRRNT
jgi:hypothetical protein